MSKTSPFNEADLESPGYEYLRSYQNMNSLLYKLVALNYHDEFCSLYKCPPIHKYYFSIPNRSASEQLFVYTCLCAWLIKEKCQMNLELGPEEYEDSDITISVIIEAVTLLLNSDTIANVKKVLSLGRLHQGFGPEVVWTLNILADRALELMLESKPDDSTIKVIYNSKSVVDLSKPAAANYITIGQPFVGGGLTTRPLGSYQIDDRSLLFEDIEDDGDNTGPEQGSACIINDMSPEEWYAQVSRASDSLDSSKVLDKTGNTVGLAESISAFVDSRNALQRFVKHTGPMLAQISTRIDRQMQLISRLEGSVESKLGDKYERFLQSWQIYSRELSKHKELSQQVDHKTGLFEQLNSHIEQIDRQIEHRIKELNDGSVLEELETKIGGLISEGAQLDLQVGLLLHVYAKMQTQSEDAEPHRA